MEWKEGMCTWLECGWRRNETTVVNVITSGV
jgi:hypothetical protein